MSGVQSIAIVDIRSLFVRVLFVSGDLYMF